MGKMTGHGLWVLAAQVALVNGLGFNIVENNQKEPFVRACGQVSVSSRFKSLHQYKYTSKHVCTDKRPVNLYRPLFLRVGISTRLFLSPSDVSILDGRGFGL